MFRLSKLQSLCLLAKNRLSSKVWYPKVPLALAAALIGLLHLIPLIEYTLGRHFVSILFADIHREFVDLTLRGVPQSAVGALLLIMSLGLLWRSRFA
jgi:voltage-gated potassium channel